MKKQLTLHQKFLRMKAEELLKKMGTPICLPDLEDEIVEEKEAVPPTLNELELKVQKTVDDAEQFFAQFGLAPEKQDELFNMPMIQQHQDEIVTNVMREREELERTIGRPRNGWDLLPFEKMIETEKILKNLPKHIENEKVKEIRLDEIFDRSAEVQIMAVQQRLSAALEDVKEAVNRQKEAMSLPALPKREDLPSLDVKPILELPDLQEKRKIDAHCEHHYSEQLKIVLPQEDVLEQAIIVGNFSSKGKETQSIHSEDLPSHKNEDENLSMNGEVRAIEAIAEDIEKMAFQTERIAEAIPASKDEGSPSVIICKEIQPINKKSSALRPNCGIVISALKSKIQHENSEKSELIGENLEPGKTQEETFINDLFKGVALPELPSSSGVMDETDAAKNAENNEKMTTSPRRPMGPRRFSL